MKHIFNDINILYEDTDHSGYAYHGNYWRYFERARQHLIGLENMKMLQKENVNFTIIKISTEFKSGAVFGDRLFVETDYKIDGIKLIFNQRIFKYDSNKLVSEAETTLICINTKLSPIAIPEILIRILSENTTHINYN